MICRDEMCWYTRVVTVGCDLRTSASSVQSHVPARRTNEIEREKGWKQIGTIQYHAYGQTS